MDTPLVTAKGFATREEWLDARKDSIGGSDLPALFGYGNRSALQVQYEKLGELPPMEMTRRYRIGLILEPEVALAAEEALKMHLFRPAFPDPLTGEPMENVIFTRSDLSYAHATPDRLAMRPGETVPKVDVSLKTWTTSNKGSWTDHPPIYALLQLQHELLITGLECGYIQVLFGLAEESRTFGPYEPRPDLHQRILNELPIWWQRHIVERRPARATAEDTDLLKMLYPQSEPLSWVYLGGEEWQAKYLTLLSQDLRLKELKTSVSELENEFKQAMETASYAVVGDAENPLALSWKSFTRTDPPRESKTVTMRPLRKGVKIPREIIRELDERIASTQGDAPHDQLARDLGPHEIGAGSEPVPDAQEDQGGEALEDVE